MTATNLQMTMAELARTAGVSTMTVSRAIRGSGRIDPATRSRIIDLAARAGYKPNSAARAMLTGQFHCLSLLLSTVDGRSTLPSDMLRGVQDELIALDMHLNVSMLPDASLVKKWGMPSALRRTMCDGLLINYTHAIPTQLLSAIRKHSMPSVWINSKLDQDCVYPDDFGAARTLTAELLKAGHRRIAYADVGHDLGRTPASAHHYSVADRLEGYHAAMREAGLAPLVLTRMIGLEAERDVSFAAVMNRPDRPTAVVCYGMSHVTGLAMHAYQMGLQLPRDLVLTTFDAVQAGVGVLKLPTMKVPNQKVGQRAVQMVMARIHGEVACAAEAIPVELVGAEEIIGPS